MRLFHSVEEIEDQQIEALLLNLTDAARALAVGRTTLYKLIDDGEIRVVRIGRAVRVSVTELDAFVAGRLNDRLSSGRVSLRTEAIRPGRR